MPVLPFVLFLLTCLFWSIFLVWVLKYDLRFDRTVDPEYDADFPLISKSVSVIKLFPRYIVLSTLLALFFCWVWNLIAAKAGWTLIPALHLSNFQGFKYIYLDRFWNVASGFAFLLGVLDSQRCLAIPVTSHWDVFISYKSEDVDVARRVADHLIASGLKVWFAEYQVLLKNYDKFQQAIDYGIAHCDYGIAFTNNRYVNSPYCALEIMQLLEHLPPQKILEVMIPRQEPLPHQKYQALENCPGFVGSDLPEILDFIRQHTAWEILPLETDPDDLQPGSHTFRCMNRPASLEITGWELKESGKVVGGNTDLFMLEHQLHRDQYLLFVNVVCGPELSRQGQREEQDSNDRATYQFLRHYSETHVGRIGAQMHGLHLFFHNGFSHIALTYRMHRYWTRKYSVIIPNPSTHQMAEFVFTFGFMGSFKEYCLNVHRMDKLVKSLQWN